MSVDSVSEGTRRIDQLAQHRKEHAGFIPDRRSVYWVDKLPPLPGAKCVLTDRQMALAISKPYHKDYKPDRPTSIWKVGRGALVIRENNERIKILAKPKPFPVGWMPMRCVQTIIPERALKAQPSKRLKKLSRPKSPTQIKVREETEWEWGEWKSDIPKNAMNYQATARLEQLAEPKASHKDYIGSRPVIWLVPEEARQAQANTRLSQLARPKTRQALDQDYDPYRVSYAAKMAVPSPRVEDLCKPIPRKVRTKKLV